MKGMQRCCHEMLSEFDPTENELSPSKSQKEMRKNTF